MYMYTYIYIYIYIYIIHTVLLYREEKGREEKRREEKRREEKRREEKRREEKRREEKRREVMQHGRLRLLLCPCMQKCDLQSHHGMLATQWHARQREAAWASKPSTSDRAKLWRTAFDGRTFSGCHQTWTSVTLEQINAVTKVSLVGCDAKNNEWNC